MAILDTLIFSAYPSGCLCTFALPLLNLPVWSIFTSSLYTIQIVSKQLCFI